jgi:hypothetical protein
LHSSRAVDTRDLARVGISGATASRMMKELACDQLDAVMGGNMMSTFRSPTTRSPPSDAPRPLSAAIDPLSFTSSCVGGSSLGGDDGRLRLSPIDRPKRRVVRGTVSTGVVISPLAGSEASATRVVRRRA